MRAESKAFVTSIGMHLTVLLLAFVVMKGTTPATKMLVIDFSLAGRPAAAQTTPPPSRAAALPAAAVTRAPIPARTAERRIAPPKEATPERTLQVQRVATAEEQVPVAVPEPVPSPFPETGTGTPGPALSQGIPGSDSGIIRSGGDHGPAGAAPITGPAEGAGTRYVKAHFAGIRGAIVKKLAYPPLARKKGWMGTVKISFVVGEDGCVGSVRVLATSGFEVLDSNAVETVRRCSPYPKPPAAAEIVMPITYRLE